MNVKEKEPKIAGKVVEPVDVSEGGVLALLWRKIVFENKLSNMLKYFLDKYKGSGGGKSTSTIQQAFIARSMTWKTFVHLVLEILPVKKMRVIIELDFIDGTKSTHSVDIYPSKKSKKDVDKDEIKKAKKYLKD